ncbi:MAG: hypothetical protein P4M09_02695, partial [Devosia sp.]|nr:hypothetical protein [Devosia sp.]
MIRLFTIALIAASLQLLPAAATETAQVPSPNGTMVTEIFKPAGPGPFPVVIFSHGRSGEPSERASLTHPVNSSVAAYWTAKGFAVVAPIRPGYGPSGGPDREADDSPYCSRPAKFA